MKENEITMVNEIAMACSTHGEMKLHTGRRSRSDGELGVCWSTSA
jgi:hypothetical protein